MYPYSGYLTFLVLTFRIDPGFLRRRLAIAIGSLLRSFLLRTSKFVLSSRPHSRVNNSFDGKVRILFQILKRIQKMLRTTLTLSLPNSLADSHFETRGRASRDGRLCYCDIIGVRPGLPSNVGVLFPRIELLALVRTMSKGRIQADYDS